MALKLENTFNAIHAFFLKNTFNVIQVKKLFLISLNISKNIKIILI